MMDTFNNLLIILTRINNKIYFRQCTTLFFFNKLIEKRHEILSQLINL